MVPITIKERKSVRPFDLICGYPVKWHGVQTVLKCPDETECVLPPEIVECLCDKGQVVRMVEPEDAIVWNDWEEGYSYGNYNSFTVYDSRFADAVRDKFNNMLFTDEKVES